MGELHKEFLKQTISNLQSLQTESSGQEIFSEDFLRRFFRHLHTIKGTSNTFNLNNLAHLSHEVEDLLEAIQNAQISQTAVSTFLIQTGFEHLLQIAQNYLAEKETVFPQDFADRIKAVIPNSNLAKRNYLLYRKIPHEFLGQLSAQEKTALGSALQKGKFFQLLEVTFQISNFDEKFKILREKLNETGEVIAVSSATNKNPHLEILFQIFYVTNLSKVELEGWLENFSVKTLFESYSSNQNYADNLVGMVANLIAEGEKIAGLLDKKIAFETSLEIREISQEHLILLHEIVSHLLHNAIDHGIETIEKRIEQGKNPLAKIEINISTINQELLLQIKDDGCGIDPQIISQRATQKGLIIDGQVLDEQEALEITFSPGFSTRETVTEISGRGIGLDAVKDLVEKANGRIQLDTLPHKGTTFSIYLPQN